MPPPDDQGDRVLTMELVERFGGDVSALALREGELTAARHETEVRLAGRDVAATSLAAVALGTAFLLANWAAVRALSETLSGWRAPLVIAAVWLVVGIAVAAMPLSRLRHMLRGPGRAGITVEERERARDQALEAVRESLGALASAVAEEAQARVVSAVVPSADGLVDAGEDILEASEDLVDDLVDDVPGGGVVGQVIDVALIPGRFGVRVATTVLKGGSKT